MPQPNPEYIRELVAAVNASPFPEHMSMRLRSIELDQAVIELRTANCQMKPRKFPGEEAAKGF